MTTFTQVSPELQESYFDFQEYVETNNAAIFGNREFTSYRSELCNQVEDVINGGWLELDAEEEGTETDPLSIVSPYFGNVSRETAMDIIDCMHKYSIKTHYAVTDLYKQYADIMTILTRKKYTVIQLTGCAQSEWIYCLLPEENEHDHEFLEAFYFNTGSEWIDEEGYNYYLAKWSYEDIKKELAYLTGSSAKDITLQAFDHYSSVPVYSIH